MANQIPGNQTKNERLVCHYYWSLLDKLLVGSALCSFLCALSLLVLYGQAQLFWTSLIIELATFVLALILLGLRNRIFSPEQLFKRLKEAIEMNILDTGRLKNWHHWQETSHIKTIAIFYDQATAMLDSLDDFYSCLLSPEQASQAMVTKSVPLAEIGLNLGILRTPEGMLVLDNGSNLLPVVDSEKFPLVSSVVADSSIHKSGILSGDSLTSINNKSLKGLSLAKIHEAALLQKGKTATFGFSRNGRGYQVSLSIPSERYSPIKTKTIQGFGYIRFESFWDGLKLKDIESALHKISKDKAIIIDLRSNRGGDIKLALGALSAFVDQGTLAFCQKRIDGTTNDLRFELYQNHIAVEQLNKQSAAYENLEPKQIIDRLKNKFTGKKIVVLIDEYSMSGAELFAGAMKDLNRAHIIGTPSFGKGIGQDEINIPPYVRFSITSMRYTTPNGTWVGDGGLSVRNGIVPSEIVTQSIGTALGAIDDTQLSAAIRYLLES